MQFYFAWIPENEEFSHQKHLRLDEQIFSLDILEREGQIPHAKIEVHRSLSSIFISNKQQHKFAIISVQHKQKIYPLFRGKLSNCPYFIGKNTIQLEFLAVSKTNIKKSKKILNQLKQDKFYPYLFLPLSERNDPSIENLLENKMSLMYWHRNNQNVKLSNIFQGSKNFAIKNNFLPDSLKIKLLTSPIDKINVTINAKWQQFYQGSTAIGHQILQASKNKGIQTFSGKNLIDSWWYPEKTFTNGYKVSKSFLREIESNAYYQNIDLSPLDPLMINAQKKLQHLQNLKIKCRTFIPFLDLDWQYIQSRHEQVLFTLKNATQNFAYSAGKTKNIPLNIHDLAASCSEFTSKGSFFITDLGKQYIEQAINIAKAHLAYSSRCIEISFCCPLEQAINIDCDSNITITDDRIPGNIASGKVKSIQIKANHYNKNISRAYITIACAIGKNNLCDANTSQTKPFLYADAQVLQPDIVYNKQNIQTLGGLSINDHRNTDKIVGFLNPEKISANDIIKKITIVNSGDNQENFFAKLQFSHSHNFLQDIQNYKTAVKISLKPLHNYSVAYHKIVLNINHPWTAPCQINL